MLAIFLAPVYILANVFTAYWLLRWMKEVHPLFRHPAVLGVILVLYAFFALSLLTSFLIKRDPVHRILKVISNCCIFLASPRFWCCCASFLRIRY